MKKIIYGFVFCLLIGLLAPGKMHASQNEQYFIVTSYYSPLPDQKYYITGSYEGDMRLNGRGVRGASGKEVFSGMLAAPKNYKFGTKIDLEGLGIGSVEDRGGAIVNAGKRGYLHDRIDVWVGYGDEGLRRAMYWGKRKVKGTFVNNDINVTLDYNNIPAPLYVNKIIEKIIARIPDSKKSKKLVVEKKEDIFSVSLHGEEKIRQLQEILVQLGIYDGEIDGDYENIRGIIQQYQLDNEVIISENDLGAGYFGPKTRKSLQLTYSNYLDSENRKKILSLKIEELEKKSLEKAEMQIALLGNISYKEVSQEVRELQLILKEFGYFEYKDTAIFGKKTLLSMTKYQLSKGLIENESEMGAGIFGPKTKEAMIVDLKNKYLDEFITQEDLDLELLAQIQKSKQS